MVILWPFCLRAGQCDQAINKLKNLNITKLEKKDHPLLHEEYAVHILPFQTFQKKFRINDIINTNYNT